MKTRIIDHKNFRFHVRDDTSDTFIVKEVTGGAYGRLNISSDDVIRFSYAMTAPLV